MIKKLVSHLGEYKAASIKTPLFAALEAIMDVLLPTIMAFIIDQGIEKGDMNAIIRYGLLTFLVAAIALVLGVLAGKYAAEASTGFAGNLRDAMYENIQHYSFSNIDKFSTAGLVTRMTTDVTNVQNAFQMILRMCVRAPVHLVFAMFMAVIIGGPSTSLTVCSRTTITSTPRCRRMSLPSAWSKALCARALKTKNILLPARACTSSSSTRKAA